MTVAWWNERKALARELAANQREATVRRQREVAQNQTLAALNDIFFTLAEQLNNGDPITPDERIELLQQSLKFHTEFVNEAPMDRQKRHRLSIAYHHLANALTNVGRNDESLEARLQTVRLLDELLQEKPSNKLLFQKGVAFFNLSDLYAMRHDRTQQTDYALKAAEVLRQVIAVEPENTDYREVLIGIQAKLYAVESDPHRQEQMMRDVVKASTALWESAPQQPRYAKFGVFASVELASLLGESGRGDEAYEQLKATERLYDRAFDSVRTQDWAESIARVMVRRGEWLLMQLGKWQDVCEFARRGEELEQPGDLTESTGIVCAYKIFHCHALAIALKQLGDVQAAEKALQQAAMYEKDLPCDKEYLNGLLASVKRLKTLQDAGQQSTEPQPSER